MFHFGNIRFDMPQKLDTFILCLKLTAGIFFCFSFVQFCLQFATVGGSPNIYKCVPRTLSYLLNLKLVRNSNVWAPPPNQLN